MEITQKAKSSKKSSETEPAPENNEDESRIFPDKSVFFN
jgi:hypothetical protein